MLTSIQVISISSDEDDDSTSDAKAFGDDPILKTDNGASTTEVSDSAAFPPYTQMQRPQLKKRKIPKTVIDLDSETEGTSTSASKRRCKQPELSYFQREVLAQGERRAADENQFHSDLKEIFANVCKSTAATNELISKYIAGKSNSSSADLD